MRKRAGTRRRLAIYAALLGFCITLVPAVSGAGVTEWSYSDGGRMRLAALSEPEPGKITAILEIEPLPGWKTYWRDPGDAGLPPQLDLSAATNVKLVRVDFPPPEIGRDEGGRFIGYHRPVSLVLELEKTDRTLPAAMDAAVLIGVCKDICLPFQSRFNLDLDTIALPVADEFMKIQMARAALPEKSSDDFGVTSSGLTPDGRHFEARLILPGPDMPDIAIAPSPGLLLGAHPDVKRNGVHAVLRYEVKRQPKSLDGATVTLLVKSGGRSMETTLAVR